VAEPDPAEEFRRLFQRSVRNLLGQAYLLTGDQQEAQDLVQEVFLRAWRSWPRLTVMQAQDAWLRHVLNNLVASRWRSLMRRRRRQFLVSATDTTPAVGAGHLDVLQALRSLPPRQARALVLVAILDLTTAEAAAEMNANEGTVRVWVSRGRINLARALSRNLEPTDGGPEHAL
jgi:RNA polymerase sigma-70 factor (ECF subfamily)